MTAVLDYNALALELLRMDGFEEPNPDFDPLPGWNQITDKEEINEQRKASDSVRFGG
ncbi:MAG: hypothetical protein GVY12_08960 [Bacteroidetes bacterium]|jgi:hypothetical protein|nr:hypothetical protein [Bacteroidota bacterium]